MAFGGTAGEFAVTTWVGTERICTEECPAVAALRTSRVHAKMRGLTKGQYISR